MPYHNYFYRRFQSSLHGQYPWPDISGWNRYKIRIALLNNAIHVTLTRWIRYHES